MAAEYLFGRKARWTKPALNQRITWIEKNPHYKRAGSAAGMRFAWYHGSVTVAEYRERGGTWADLKYDIEHHLLAVLKSTQEKPKISAESSQSTLVSAKVGGLYIVTLNNEELISTQAHDRRFDDKPVLKVNRDNRKFGKAESFTGREMSGYVRTFGRQNVNFFPIIRTTDTQNAEAAVSERLRPWRLTSPSGHLTEWTKGISTQEMVEMILEAVHEARLRHDVIWQP